MWAIPLPETLSWFPTAFKKIFLSKHTRPFVILLSSPSLASSLSTGSSNFLHFPKFIMLFQTFRHTFMLFHLPRNDLLTLICLYLHLAAQSLSVMFPRKSFWYCLLPPKWWSMPHNLAAPSGMPLRQDFPHCPVSSRMDLVLPPFWPKSLKSHC